MAEICHLIFQLNLPLMNNLNFFKISAINFIFALVFFPLQLFASSQAGDLTILNGPIILLPPDNFTIPPTFFSNSIENTQVLLNPNLEANNIRVLDSRNAGDFSVDARITDFISPEGSIPHENIGILTTNIRPFPHSVDISPSATADDVTAPLNYEWDFVSPIPNNEFTPVPAGLDDESTPFLIMDGINPGIVGREGVYSIAPSLNLQIPANQPVSNFNSTLTLTLNS